MEGTNGRGGENARCAAAAVLLGPVAGGAVIAPRGGGALETVEGALLEAALGAAADGAHPVGIGVRTTVGSWGGAGVLGALETWCCGGCA